jgi:hypothetical protein
MNPASTRHFIPSLQVASTHGLRRGQIQHPSIQPPTEPTDSRRFIAIDMISKLVTPRALDPLPRQIAPTKEMIERNPSKASFAAKFGRQVRSPSSEIGRSERSGIHA